MHVGRLEEVFKLLGIAARGKTCEGMKGLIEEGQEVMEEMEGTTLDAALIASAQKVEHYEIATYGTLATFAEVLEHAGRQGPSRADTGRREGSRRETDQIAGQINPEAENEEGEQEEGSMASVGSRSSRTGANGGARKSAGSRGRKR